MDLSKQYNNIVDSYTKFNISDVGNNFNRDLFYSYIDFIKPGMNVLDLACGDVFDIENYKKAFNAEFHGLDASEEMIERAKKRLPDVDFKVGFFENLPFSDKEFDVVLSKYALMTSADLEPVFKEINRVLKPGGTLMYLVTHPFRQYFEKKDNQADYFEKKQVESRVFDNQVSFTEPSHVLTEYLNEYFFKNFDVQAYDERFDPAAEKIDGRKYPGFFILKAIKRK